MNGFMQSIKKRLIALGVVLVLLAAAGGYWYVDIYTKTPEYTLKMVQEAVSDHNKEKLDKYVAVDHLLDTASDDMLDGLIQAMVPATGDTREAVSNLSRMFKTPVVTSLRTAVMNYVEYGSWINQKSDDNSVNGLVDADMIVKVKEPIEPEYPLIREGQVVFTYFHFASFTRWRSPPDRVESGCPRDR